MKLLFDQNLSFRICQRIADIFPDSSQVRLIGLAEANDRVLWDYARTHDKLRSYASVIISFADDDAAACLEIC